MHLQSSNLHLFTVFRRVHVEKSRQAVAIAGLDMLKRVRVGRVGLDTTPKPSVGKEAVELGLFHRGVELHGHGEKRARDRGGCEGVNHNVLVCIK